MDAENIRHLTECPGCCVCDDLMEFYLACDECGAWGNKDCNHNYVMRENGAVICEPCQNIFPKEYNETN